MEVISTRRYEARPPADSHASILVDPAKSVATVKEEEWETRKKKEITTTRQIETRVKRQVVLEDGEVVVDSGPLVTTNTTEDVEQQEHTTQERRTSGDEPKKVEWPAAKNGPVVQKELNETIVKSREEIEELLETEDRQHLGDISDEAYLQAVRNNRGDLRVALAESQRQLAGDKGGSPGPRVLQHTTRSNKVVDTEKTLERSELKHTGQIVTERKTTVEHEEIKDEEAPAELSNGRLDEADEAWETRKEATQRYTKCRDEDIVDYVSNGERVAREMRFVSETTEAERTGDWPTDSAASLRNRLHKHGFDRTDAGRKDAVTRKPLDLEEEDEARKFETSKWLESHFGSESRSSRDGSDDEPPVTTSKKRHPPRTKSTTNTSYINVTMKSSVAPQPPQQQQQHYRTSASSHPTRPVVNGRGSNSPSQYFHGISEWSERYQSTEKQQQQQQQQQHSHTTRAKSPVYIMESAREREQQSERRVNGHHGPSPDSVEREERRHQQQHQQQLQSTQSAQSTAARNHKETSYSRSYEASRRHQERHSPPHDRPKTDPPSPPLRRKAREQASSAMKERSYREHVDSVERGSSPVHVVQRTWESRTRDERQEEQREQRKPPRQSSVTHHNGHAAASSARSSSSRRRVQHSPERTRPRPRSPPHSRSISPSPPRSHKKDERTRPSKSPSPSKYKIGESFRKLVGKLRSASSERKNGLQGKKSGSSSTSQLTQTDEGSTYLQYNAVDRNVPLGPEYGDGEEPGSGRAPDRPPRSPKNHVTHPTTTLNLTSCNNNNREPSRYSSKFRAGSASPRHDYRDDRLAGSHHQQQPQPIHRYYLGEDPFGGSIYGKEKEYNSKPHSRHRSHRIEYDYSGEPSSLGRFSKSTSRLAYEYGHSENERSSAQTLPRKMHHTSSSASSTNNNNNNNHTNNNNNNNNNNNSTTNNNNHMNNNNSNNHYGRHQRRTTTTTTTTTTNGSSSPLHRLGHNGAGPEPKYGSMINISFRNPLSPKPPAAHYYPAQPPKPERTYKSTLSRSKSFNVEIGEDGVVTNPRQPKTNGYANGHSNGYTNGYSNGYSHNIRSTTHLNKLDETPPLKSPGILASISRSRNDLVRNGRRDY